MTDECAICVSVHRRENSISGFLDTNIRRLFGNLRYEPAGPRPRQGSKIDCVRRAEPLVRDYCGPTACLLAFAYAVTPKLYDFLVPYVFAWGAFRSEPPEQGPGNIFEPTPKWNQVTGG